MFVVETRQKAEGRREEGFEFLMFLHIAAFICAYLDLCGESFPPVQMSRVC
jgi:hypothetical protein